MTNISSIPNPCYLLDEEALLRNLRTIDHVRRETGAEIIVALKACAMWSIFPTLAEHSDGATASSLSEARLVVEEYGQRCHTYAPVYTAEEIDDILECSSHITFNSLTQLNRFKSKALQRGVSCGVRVNPRYSPVETDLYNPCVAGSRLGIPPEELESLPEGVEGIHFHVLCESRSEHLRLALEAVERHFGHLLPQLKWLNMGGGHLMTHEEYDTEELITILRKFAANYPNLRLILEPGSAFTWRTGSLIGRVEDIVVNEGVRTAMLNVSFACHMPDCLEMPYQPTVRGAQHVESGGWRLGGNSCLAGDFMGEWSFRDDPKVGDVIIFEDMIHYTMVKSTMFNGVSHPTIAIRRADGSIDIVRKFGYEDYKSRMS